MVNIVLTICLPRGHHAAGLLADGMKIDLYREGGRVLNMVIGKKADVKGWPQGRERSRQARPI